MLVRWHTRPLILLGLLLQSLTSAAHSFENTAIVRTVELGGSIVHVTTTYAIRALEDNASKYTIALGEQEAVKTSWLEAKVKGKPEALKVDIIAPSRIEYVTRICALSSTN